MAPTVARLAAPIRTYAWGSRTVLAELQGRPAPTDEPEAELWFGAHSTAPSRIVRDAEDLALDAAIAADPAAWLGSEVVGRFGPRLPFLLKILAVDAPLSLQVHPSAVQAEVGFDADEAAGIPIDAPERRYRDRWPKPELVRAVTPFAALCGFRPVERTLELLDHLAVPSFDGLARQLGDEGPTALTSLVAQLLALPPSQRAELVAAVASATERAWSPDGPFAAELRWLRRLAERYPEDAGVAVAVLLDLVELPPGGSIHLPAGHLHAYLHGTAVEVMAGSDNVLRGGLTAKHVDVDELLRVLAPGIDRLPPVEVVPGVDRERVHRVPTSFFRLSELVPGDRAVMLDHRGPEILLALDGEARITSDGSNVTLRPGEAAIVPACARVTTVSGLGVVIRTTVGDG
jgi:mannose-6-phosphate isomerase